MKPNFKNYVKKLLFSVGCTAFALFSGNNAKSQTLTIGAEEGSSYDFPLTTCMSFNYTQMIYLQDELIDAGAPGPILITKLSFKAGPWESSSTNNYKDWVVYMGNTGTTGFWTATSWAPLASLTEVFDGELPDFVSSGTWVELTLTTPFFWDGESNLIIAVDENTPGWHCSQDWAGYWTSDMRAIIYNSDDANPDPASPPSSLWRTDMVPYIRLEYEDAAACEDIAFAAGIISGSDVCQDVAFTVMNSGTVLASGVTREWQKRVPAGTGDWTTIEGETSIHYTNNDGISVPTDYRCIVTCDATGESETTNVITININPFTECYCEPILEGGCAWSAVVNDVYTSGALTDISNMGTGCTGGYEDYSGEYEISAVQYSMMTISVGLTGSTAGIKIWIDWNQNGSFDDEGELVGASLTELPPGSTYTTLVEVPDYAVPGTTKMRVAAVSWDIWYDPCMSSTWDSGEAEDYAFTVIEALPCNELDLVAGELSSFEICPSIEFMITNSGTTIGAGIVREWQQRVPSGTGEWTTIEGASSVHYINSAGITEPTDYRCIVSCPETGEEVVTDVVTLSISPFEDCYCTPVYMEGCMWSATIDDVKTTGGITDISNLGSGCGGGYTDYSSEHTADFMQLQSITVEVGITNSWGGVIVWIDYNQNGLFEDAEIVGESFESVAAETSFTSTFTVPLDAVPGWTKMRVRTVGWTTGFDPCETFWNGEAEDYRINIVPAPNCSEVEWPATIASLSSPGAVCGSGTVYLNLNTSEIPLAAGVAYQWQSSPTAAGGSWTNASDNLSHPGFIMSGISSSTYFRCVIKCNGEPLMNSENIFIESVAPEAPEVSSGQHCGPGSVELSASIGSGFVYWYEEAEGGMPFAVGETIMTPAITETTTYFVKGGAFPPALVQIGEATSSSSPWSVGPFNIENRRSTMQMLYTADQISEAGGTAGMIEDLRFYLTGLPSEGIPDYTISIKYVPGTMNYLTKWQIGGFTEVYSNSLFEPTETGWQIFSFDDPIFYDGQSGMVIQICWSNVEAFWTGTGTHRYTITPGQMLFNTTADEGNSCGVIGEWTANELPNVIFNFTGCVSDAVPVVAYIRDTPVVRIDKEDGVYCLFNNTMTLNAAPEQPDGISLLWNTGENTSSITVSSGTGSPEKFWLAATNEWGCVTTDTARMVLNPSPVVDLGPDVSVCEDSEVILNAGTDGELYYWNNGATTPAITVDEEGIYTVLVTNIYGCMSMDTIEVVLDGYAPRIDGIMVNNLGPTRFSFTPLNPEYILTYKWNFGDDTEEVTIEAPEHQYETPGTYEVKLEVTSSCGTVEFYTFVTIALSTDEIDRAQSLDIYPNPTQQYLNIESRDGVKMNQLQVINSLGQVLMTQKINSSEKLQLNVSELPAGNYYIYIQSDKGELIRKFQIVR